MNNNGDYDIIELKTEYKKDIFDVQNKWNTKTKEKIYEEGKRKLAFDLLPQIMEYLDTEISKEPFNCDNLIFKGKLLIAVKKEE